jgi:hypothetical protein
VQLLGDRGLEIAELVLLILRRKVASEYLTRAEETRKNLWKLPQALVVNKPDIGSGKS